MVATSVARLTLASTTPSVFRRKRSIRLLHEAQVIPATGKLTSSGSRGAGAIGVVTLILPRSISPDVGRPPRAGSARGPATLRQCPIPPQIAPLGLGATRASPRSWSCSRRPWGRSTLRRFRGESSAWSCGPRTPRSPRPSGREPGGRSCQLRTPLRRATARAHLQTLEREILEHFAGTRAAFDVPVVLEGIGDGTDGSSRASGPFRAAPRPRMGRSRAGSARRAQREPSGVRSDGTRWASWSPATGSSPATGRSAATVAAGSATARSPGAKADAARRRGCRVRGR